MSRMVGVQRLLFGETNFVFSLYKNKFDVPQDFYSNGYTVINGIKNTEEARKITEMIIANIDTAKLPLFLTLLPRIQLAKADLIPVCNDSVETNFQALHFDMGQPFFSNIPQTMYTTIGLYFPKDKTPGTAKTRVLNLKNFFNNKNLNTRNAEKRILKYVKNHGDGWNDFNTHRISCFARIVDAVTNSNELIGYRDKTMAQWFDGNIKSENNFYKMKGFDLKKIEEQIQLKPGQLLILDNTRVAHGRIGKRNVKEIYQMMFGIKYVTSEEIGKFRKSLVSNITS